MSNEDVRKNQGLNAAKYPQLVKYAAADLEMREITAFLEWLEETKRYEIAAWRPSGQSMLPMPESREALLAQYFEIDTVALENERRALLAESRRLGAADDNDSPYDLSTGRKGAKGLRSRG